MNKEETRREIEVLRTEVNKKINDLENSIIEQGETKEKYITVADGFRGSLRLKYCCVKFHEDQEGWDKMFDVEIVVRCSSLNMPYVVRFKGEPRMTSAKYLKFKPFSPENPPSVDWPVKNKSGYTSHFSHYVGDSIRVYVDGRTSLSNLSIEDRATNSGFTFLNIEEVKE